MKNINQIIKKINNDKIINYLNKFNKRINVNQFNVYKKLNNDKFYYVLIYKENNIVGFNVFFHKIYISFIRYKIKSINNKFIHIKDSDIVFKYINEFNLENINEY